MIEIPVTFPELCQLYAETIARITALENLPAGYWQEDDPHELEDLRAREIELRAALQAHWKAAT